MNPVDRPIGKRAPPFKGKTSGNRPDAFVQTAGITRKIPVGPIVIFFIAVFLITLYDANTPKVGPKPATELCGDGVCGTVEYKQGSCAVDCILATPLPSAEPEETASPSEIPPVALKEIVLENEANRFGARAIPQDVFFETLEDTALQWIIVKTNPAVSAQPEIELYLSKKMNVVVQLDVRDFGASASKITEFAGKYGSGKGPYVKYYIVRAAQGANYPAVYDAIRKGCPACKIIVEAESNYLVSNSAQLLNCKGPCFDILGLQQYDNLNTSEVAYYNLKNEMDGAKAWLEANGLQRPIWVTGTAAYGGKYGKAAYRRDDQQANALFKSASFALAQGAQKVFFSNPAGCYDGEDAYFCSTAVTDLASSKAGLFTLKALVTGLDRSQFVSELPSPRNSTHALKFTTPTGTAYAIWSDEFQEAFKSIGISVGSTRIRYHDVVTGEVADRDATGSNIGVTLKYDSLLLQELKN